MKLLDVINETQEERLLKRAKTIFRAFKEGTITRSDGVSFSYVINDNIEVRVRNGELELYGFVSKIVERTYCPINERYMTELIAKRFRRFGITTELTMPKKENLHKYQGKKPWEEDLNENLVHKITDEDRKKVKLVHRAIKSGVVNVNDVRYRYELPENYEMSPANNKIIRIRFEFYRGDLRGNNRGEKLPLKIWRIEDGKDVYINGLLDNTDVSDICYGEHYHQKETTQEYMKIKNVVRRRYNNFNIALDVSPIERPLKTININPLNEQDDVVITDDYTYPTKEQKKRARIIYHAFKKGKFTIEDGGGTYKYVLPDEYYVSVSGDGVLNIVLTMNPQQKMKMYYVTKKYDGTTVELEVETKVRTYLHQWMMDNIENKFKQFQINFIF